MLTAGGWLGGINFGADQARLPELASLLTVYAAAIYFVPPTVAGDAFPGRGVGGRLGRTARRDFMIAALRGPGAPDALDG